MSKTVVCDSSSLIALSECCTLSALDYLKRKAGVSFVAPKGVFQESVLRPSGIPKYAASALRIKRAFLNDSIRQAQEDVRKETARLLETANHLFFVEDTPLALLQEGEAECLALAKKTRAAGVLVDEKTLRMLIEDPPKMGRRLQDEYSGKIRLDERKRTEWAPYQQDTRIVRSTELLTMAYREGFFETYGDDAYAAFKGNLHALKQAGCSITPHELKEYEKLA